MSPSHRRHSEHDDDDSDLNLSCDESNGVSKQFQLSVREEILRLRDKDKRQQADIDRLNRLVIFGKDGDGEDSLIQRMGRMRFLSYIVLTGIPLIPILAQLLQWLVQAIQQKP